MLRVNDDADEIPLGDVLDAMADCLLEVQMQPTLKEIPDKKPTQPSNQVKKPPREVFYNDSIKFAPKPPKPVLRQLCTCKYLCRSAKAVIKCLSCALYDPTGLSYYCQMCFDARHPWYRVTHIFTTIFQDELLSINMKLQREAIETDRYLDDGRKLIEKVANNIKKVELVADDENIENNMRVIGRKVDVIEEKLRGMRRAFRQQLAGQGAEITFSDEDGVAMIQRIFRGFRIRRVISLLYAERTIRVWDALAGREFYYDRSTHCSSWTPPLFLMKMDIRNLPVMDLDEDGNTKERHIWHFKNLRKRRRKNKVVDKKDSARIITGFFRCIKARRRIIQAAQQLIVRVWDPDFEQHYYSNLRTGDSSWSKPKIFLSEDAPLLLTENQNKRSPRVNREKIVEIRALNPVAESEDKSSSPSVEENTVSKIL